MGYYPVRRAHFLSALKKISPLKSDISISSRIFFSSFAVRKFSISRLRFILDITRFTTASAVMKSKAVSSKPKVSLKYHIAPAITISSISVNSVNLFLGTFSIFLLFSDISAFTCPLETCSLERLANFLLLGDFLVAGHPVHGCY